MSENKFKVPAKSAPAKKEVSDAKAKDVKKTATKKSSSATSTKKSTTKKPPQSESVKKQVKSESPKKRVESSSTKAKKSSNLTFEKQELPKNNPNLGNYTLEERIAILNGSENKKKDEVKQEEKKEARVEITSLMESVKKNTPVAIAEEENLTKMPPKKKEKSNTLLTFILLSSILLLILIIVLLIKKRSTRTNSSLINEPTAITNQYYSNELIVTSGMSASQVASVLPSFLDKDIFLKYLKENNLTGSIRVGIYTILDTFNEADVANLITTKSESKSLIVYPGYTINDIDLALSNRSLASAGDFIKASEEFASLEGLSFIEGYFLAGEYQFVDCYDLLEQMHEALLDVLRNNPDAVSESLLSVDEIVKIASIINRETQDKEQFKVIARVVLNRYRMAMPLGIDATTRYEINNWSDAIGQSIFDKDTPYNTRRKPGLPPSGIGCPSEAALLAVLFPAESDALYYLHDEEGKLYTSLSYEEHLKTYENIHSL